MLLKYVGTGRRHCRFDQSVESNLGSIEFRIPDSLIAVKVRVLFSRTRAQKAQPEAFDQILVVIIGHERDGEPPSGELARNTDKRKQISLRSGRREQDFSNAADESLLDCVCSPGRNCPLGAYTETTPCTTGRKPIRTSGSYGMAFLTLWFPIQMPKTAPMPNAILGMKRAHMAPNGLLMPPTAKPVRTDSSETLWQHPTGALG